jgi:V/A-type H+-transporting ATPase subunit D
MPARDLAATKTNLLRLREQLQFAAQGYDLLDQKRNILIMELMALVDQCVDHQQRVEAALAGAFRSLEQAVLRMGRLRAAHCASAVNIEANIGLRARKVMGVSLPVVDTTFAEHAPYFSPMATTAWIDGSVEGFKDALVILGKLAELKISVLRLAHEVRKTVRKVNALEKIAIPDIRESLKSVQDRLEESERDMFVLMKQVKQRLEKKRVARDAAQGVPS